MSRDQRTIEEVADLLRWQYDHYTDLDTFLLYNAKGHKSIFSVDLNKQPWIDRTFIEKTILKMNQFWNGLGKGLFVAHKPYGDQIDSIPKTDEWLANFKANFHLQDDDKDDDDKIGVARMHLQWQEYEMIDILSNINKVMITIESEYVQNLTSQKAKPIIRSKLATIARDRFLSQHTCRLADTYRDMEFEVYTALSQFVETNDVSADPNVIQETKEVLQTVINNITTSGSGNVINTGHSATVTATIHQQSVGQGVTAESVAEEIRQLTAQIRELLERESIDEDTEEDVTHQLVTVERQSVKDAPNFTVAGKASSVVETLLTDALSNQTAPVILGGIQQVMAHIQLLVQ